MEIFWSILNIVSLFFWFFLGWKAVEYIKFIKKIERGLEREIEDLQYKIVNFNKRDDPRFTYVEEKIRTQFYILKEAGIIIDPIMIKNETPDPRGYSVKKVK